MCVYIHIYIGIDIHTCCSFSGSPAGYRQEGLPIYFSNCKSIYLFAGVEGWRGGGVEGWRGGGVEGWRAGGVEGWRGGGLEGWRGGGGGLRGWGGWRGAFASVA